MKIAVLRYRFIGDTVLSLPFLARLRQRHPQAEIHYYTGQDAIALMQYCPYIDQCTVFEPRTGFLSAMHQLRQQRYDKVYVLKRSFSSALLATLSGARERVGFATEGRSVLLNRAVPYDAPSAHEAQHFLSLLGPEHVPSLQVLKTTYQDCAPLLPNSVLQAVKQRFQALELPRPWLLVHAGSTHPAKCWPAEHYAALLSKLDSDASATVGTVIFTGVAAERNLAQSIMASAALSRLSVYNACGETSLLETAALLSQSDGLLSGDSGLMHLAALWGVPCVSLFGPSDPGQWGPLSDNAQVLTATDLACLPCRLTISCDDRYPCMTSLTTDMVFEALRAIFRS